MTAMLADFHFIRPEWLLLLPLGLALYWLWRRETDPLHGWREQMAPALLDALVVGRSPAKSRKGLLVWSGWMLAILAIAGPTWRLEPNPFADDATPLMVLLKADESMEQPDPAPSRLERARLKIADLAEARPGQPLGLIAYAGSAHLVLPPTRDTGIVAEMAREISPDIMPVAGDRLDLALREAAHILDSSMQGGSILVIADSVAADSGLLQAARRGTAYPVQFLAVNSQGSPADDSLRQAARSLKAGVTALDLEGGDIASVIRRAANAPVSLQGQQGGRWQEAGYWLVPLVGLAVLAMFRREDEEQGA